MKQMYLVSEPTTKTTCCCGVSALTATKFIGWLLLLGTVLQICFVANLLQSDTIDNLYTQDGKTDKESADFLVNRLGFDLVECAMALVLIVLLLIGCYKRKPALFWPYLVYAAIKVVLISIMIVLCIVAAFYGIDEAEELSPNTVAVLTAAFVIADVVAIYFGLIVVNRARKVLADEKTEF